MNVSQAGIDLTKSFEQCRLVAYQDQGGVWTIGWGHTGPEVVEGLVWTQDQGDAQLVADMQGCVDDVNSHVTVPLTQGQFDALVDFAFNDGIEAENTSTLLRILNAGDYDDCPAQFMRWVHVKGVLSPGLERRRMAEVALFNEVTE